MRVPVWLTLGVAAIVIIFGAYRVRLAFKKPPVTDDAAPVRTRKGLYAMARRTHLLIGVVYLLLGGALMATTFGWNPLGNMFASDTETPTKDKAPTKSGVPIDQLPKK